MPKITFIEQTTCPHCGHSINAYGNPQGDKPKPGDRTLCCHCAAVMVFNEDLSLRKATHAEIIEIGEDTDFQRTRRAIIEDTWRMRVGVHRDDILD